MSKIFVSEKQKDLFEKLSGCGELIFATGSKICVANLVSQFSVNRNHHNEDQLDVDDGTHHVHIDWSHIKRCEIGDFHGEGMLSFFDGETPIFRLYRGDGPYPLEIEKLAGLLV